MISPGLLVRWSINGLQIVWMSNDDRADLSRWCGQGTLGVLDPIVGEVEAMLCPMRLNFIDSSGFDITTVTHTLCPIHTKIALSSRSSFLAHFWSIDVFLIIPLHDGYLTLPCRIPKIHGPCSEFNSGVPWSHRDVCIQQLAISIRSMDVSYPYTATYLLMEVIWASISGIE